MKYKKEHTVYNAENMKVKDEDIVFYDLRCGKFDIHGLYNPYEGDGYRRIPDDVAKATSEKVFNLYKNTAGGRIRFSTDSNRIAIRVKVPHVTIRPTLTYIVTLGCDLYVETGGIDVYRGSFKPPIDMHDEYEGIIWVGEGMKEITINLPLYNDVDKIEVGVAEGSVISPHRPYTHPKHILYYGSSITQGAAASRPGLCYEAWISRKFDCDYINLGFAGSAKGEDAIVDYMTTLDISAFVCDYDHNAPNSEHLEATLPKVYQKMRAANPDIPIIFISKPDIHFDYEDCIKKRTVVMENYSKAWNSGDHNVWFVDGASLFGSDGREECTVDRTHPNDLGFYRMAQSIGKMLWTALFMERR
ncbi:MAG: SGNH/GDSL hydrolase family protein [Eubacteriales bacterium]|nr:SGNH/GDSL hydrolase family protein [Eubacteriales bacterium]